MTQKKTAIPRKYWTAAEIEILRARYPNEDTATIAADLGVSVGQIRERVSSSGIKKSKEWFRENAERNGRNNAVWLKTRFVKGHATWNKGIPCPPRGRTPDTQFKPKHLPHTYLPIGSERTSSEGYLQRKMTDTGHPPRDWVGVHHIVWLAAGRDIPPGHRVCFKDGDKRNLALDNLELVSKAELMRRNSIHSRGPEIAALYKLRGAIMRQINKRKTE